MGEPGSALLRPLGAHPREWRGLWLRAAKELGPHYIPEAVPSLWRARSPQQASWLVGRGMAPRGWTALAVTLALRGCWWRARGLLLPSRGGRRVDAETGRPRSLPENYSFSFSARIEPLSAFPSFFINVCKNIKSPCILH